VEELYIALLICAFLLGILARNSASQSEKRYQKLAKKFNELAEKTGNPELSTTYLSDADRAKIWQLKAQGETMQAVKLTRELTEMSLAESKQYVDDLEENDFNLR
jgi:ribosomal protein L7/L12